MGHSKNCRKDSESQREHYHNFIGSRVSFSFFTHRASQVYFQDGKIFSRYSSASLIGSEFSESSYDLISGRTPALSLNDDGRTAFGRVMLVGGEHV